MERKQAIYAATLLALACALGGALYYIIEVAEWVNEEIVADFLDPYRKSPWAPLYVIGAYIVSGLTFFPVTIISLAVAAVFGPVLGVLYGISGMAVSATILFFIGQAMRGRKIKELVGRNALKYDRQLGESGIAGIITLRLILFAPFSLFNLVGGLSSVKYRDFIIGTVLGLLPGFMARAVIGDSILPLVFNPTLENAAYLGMGLMLWIFLVLMARRLLTSAPEFKTA